MPEGWEWDETLFAGSAPYYQQGRLPYAPGFADALAEALALDGTGRLLDLGCGPGTVTLPLARFFAETVGADPDEGMLTEARRRSQRHGVDSIRWIRARAEELPADLGTFRVAMFAQSFHWMDRDGVAATIRDLLAPGGAFVQMSDIKEPVSTSGLPAPVPPYGAVTDLVRRFLGPVRRAGQGFLPYGTPGGEAAILDRAGFAAPQRLRVPAGAIQERTVDDIVAWVRSRSDSAPHLFGMRLAEFDEQLRQLLWDASDRGRFAERVPDTKLVIWRRPA